MLRRLRGAKLVVFTDQILASGQNFGIVVYCARVLPLTEFSVFAYALIAIQFLSSFQQGLVNTPSMTLHSLFDDRENAQYAKGLFALHILVLLGAALVFYLFMRAGPLFGQDRNTLANAGVACLYTVTRLHQEFCRRFHMARGAYRVAAASDATLVGTTIVGFAAMVLLGQRSVAAALLVLSVASLLCAWFPYRMLLLAIDRPRLDATMRRHLAQGGWFSLTSICTILGGTMVQIISGSRMGPLAVAALRACANLTRFVNLVILSMENYMPQASARALKSSTPGALHRSSVVVPTLAMAGIFIVAGGAFAVFARSIMWLIYGAKFAQFSGAAALYMLVPLLAGLSLPAGIYLRTFERSRTLFGLYLVSIVPVLPTSILLIDAYGLMGAIVTLLLSQVIYLASVIGMSVRVSRQEQRRVAATEGVPEADTAA